MVDVNFDFLHFVPAQSAPDFIRNSELAASNGWVDVNRDTLQHLKFPNVFALGDAANLPTSKTAAAVFSQTPVLIHNLLKQMGMKKTTAAYDGYTSCPLFVGDNKLMLMEFKYGGVRQESFFANQEVPRKSFFYLTRDVLPRAYFQRMP